MSQVWSVAADGGHMYSDELSDVLRTALQPLVRFRQFADIQEGKDQGKGDRLYWNIFSDAQTQGGELDETQAMPETKFTIRQESLVVTEFGNSVPFTKKLDDLSKHSVTEVINKVLKNDARVTLDSACHSKFDLAPVNITPASGNSATAVVFTDSTTPPVQNNVALRHDHVKAISDELKERNVIPYDGEHYCCIGRPATFRALKNDLENVYKYVDEGFGLIFRGEIGKTEGIRFVEQTNIPSEAWGQGLSDAAYFFGMDTVAEGIVTPEEIRGKIPTDSYGVPAAA